MESKQADILVFSDTEKVELLNYLKDKGHKTPQNWTLLHSEICGLDEAEISLQDILNRLSGYKFAVDIVSNPDLNSFLDKGLIKIRYRYIVAPGKGAPIQDNSREFCKDLVRADKIYRREDINIMSFRGSNPIAKRNYSIFRLRGHWNCRHVWQREIYFIEDPAKNVENNELIDKQIVMSKPENKTFFNKFLDLFKASAVKLSQAEIVQINKVLLDETVKLADVTDAEGRVIRVDADELAVGAAVMYVDAEGMESEVPDGEYSIPDIGQIIVVSGGSISEIKDIEDEAAAAAEDAAAAEGSDDIESRLSAFSADLLSQVDERIKEAFTKLVEELKLSKQEDVDEAIKAQFNAVSEELKKLPAFNGEAVSNKFEDNKKPEHKAGIKSALRSGWNIPESK